MAHRRMRRLVSAYLDGEVDGETAARVATHLDECWQCSSDAEATRLVKASLQHLYGHRPAAVAVASLRRWATRLRA